MKTLTLILTPVLLAGAGAELLIVPSSAAPVTARSLAAPAAVKHDHGHRHHHHDHSKPHSCSLSEPVGFAGLVDEADLVVVGVPTGQEDAGDTEGTVWATVRVSETMRGGDRARDPASEFLIRVQTGEDHGSHDPMPAGSTLLLMLKATPDQSGEAGLNYKSMAYMNAVVHLDAPECGGCLPLARSLAATTDRRLDAASFRTRAASLSEAIVSGGSITRFRAALDFHRAQVLVDAITPADVSRLVRTLDSLDGLDPACPAMLTVLASRGDAGLTPALVRVLNKPAAYRLFEELARVLAVPALRDSAAHDLNAQLLRAQTAEGRRFAAFVMARLGSVTANAYLGEMLAHEDMDVASEALIGLAGSRDAAVRTMALDTVRAGLADAPVVDSDTPVDRTLRTREFAKARFGLHTGEQFRLMAAGYWVARSPVAEDRAWLQGRLSRIPDFATRAFLKDRLINTWATYDTPW